jgi:hypothetical protein
MIVSNQLLKNTNFILFLNKIDILPSKLAAGIKFKDHVVSYGNRPNDVDSTTACELPRVALIYCRANQDGRFEEEVRCVLNEPSS